MLAAPSGSTPTMRTSGCRSRSQTAQAGDQPAAAERRDDRVHRQRDLAHQLDGDGALAGDRAHVVEGRDVDGAGALGVGERGRAGDVVRAALDDELDPALAERQDPLPLLARGVAGHVDPAVDAQPRAAPRQALAVVAGARADDAAGALGVGEPADQVVGAAHLVGAGQLAVLALEQHRCADDLAEPDAVLDLGPPYDGAQDLGRRLHCRCVDARSTHENDPRGSRAGHAERPRTMRSGGRSACQGLRARSLGDLGDPAGADGAATLTDRETQALVHGDGLDQLDRPSRCCRRA